MENHPTTNDILLTPDLDNDDKWAFLILEGSTETCPHLYDAVSTGCWWLDGDPILQFMKFHMGETPSPIFHTLVVYSVLILLWIPFGVRLLLLP